MINRRLFLGIALIALGAVITGGLLVSRPGLIAAGGWVDPPMVTLDAATTSLRWAGYSASTYNGSIGGAFGFKTANQVCNSLYPGSHWANSFEIIHLGTQYPWTQSVWLADFWYDQTKDCAHFSSGANSGSATQADTKTIYPGGINSGWTCSATFYLPCVYQP